jgi:uncharacterized protein YjbI with pentapeptide repeats
MKAAPSYQPRIVTELSTFVTQAAVSSELQKQVAVDVQAAANAIGRRDLRNDAPNTVVDIEGAHLFLAKLRQVNFAGGNLRNIYLDGAILNDADFSGANLGSCVLNHANLTNGNLSGADLTGSYLVGTILKYANATHANLTDIDFIGANFTGANLADADFDNSTLTGAKFTGAKLAGALWPKNIPPPTGWVRQHNGRLKG